ncbi:MAG: mechanosensitive ion channel family protein [Candidatus Omnitrophica bacterium]|nr:mechanosensitive ion channel family protein [Candidatus Omnitrophota bacterium]
MEKLFEFFWPSAVFLATLAAGYALRKLLLGRLYKLAQSTSSQLDDIVIEATKGPSAIWCLMLAIYFALAVSKLHPATLGLAVKILQILGILSVTLVLANIASNAVKIYSGKIEAKLPVTSLTQNFVRITIFCVGILIILNNLGISITPILATLGVGGLAIALALQDTLANLFAGLYIIAARQIKVGDYIKLETGQEGYVIDTNLRITKIKMLPNNVILIPNAKLTQSIITNYNLPDKEIAVAVNLGVHYNSDLEKVEKITCEVAEEVIKCTPGAVKGFKPFVRFNSFGESGVNLTAILRAQEFVDQYLLQHEFIKKLQARYKKEGIVIPYPVRAINYVQEKSNE